MPIFDFICEDCGKTSEIIISASYGDPECCNCGSKKIKKLISAHSSMSGPVKKSTPGSGDTSCCGSTPGEATGCSGPGSCCGKNFV
ncbi:MAG: zinc ribbon domain-containing protein [Desulfobacterales bacterium]|mgnify:CR=1 FL=1|jgi:putative FmdB family regulatory protein|nr:zinc ribbon domain-containing protein [Desulfobacteraceae bacterium]MBT4365134.1 zinc ribbon domain-containing protein [Desulfobacteraceae bacterium]MBT7698309.1 zinc ribbon domain-containing protein [Desulfobacterales bacterium]